jgi:hypothetical protein
MTFSRTTPWALGVVVLIGGSAIGRAQAPQAQAPRAPILTRDHLRFQPEDIPMGGPVFGDASKPGMYVTRNRFAAGTGSRPHYHDQDRWVTVIKGTWWTAEGDLYQPDKMTAIKPGGMMFHPAGLHHYDGAKDEDVIVQIMGMGPVQTIQTEVDEHGQAVTRGRGGDAGRGRGAQPAPGE